LIALISNAHPGPGARSDRRHGRPSFPSARLMSITQKDQKSR
jgi:hypothetical protein